MFLRTKNSQYWSKLLDSWIWISLSRIQQFQYSGWRATAKLVTHDCRPALPGFCCSSWSSLTENVKPRVLPTPTIWMEGALLASISEDKRTTSMLVRKWRNPVKVRWVAAPTVPQIPVVRQAHNHRMRQVLNHLLTHQMRQAFSHLLLQALIHLLCQAKWMRSVLESSMHLGWTIRKHFDQSRKET